MKQDEETPAEGMLLLDLDVHIPAVDAIRHSPIKAKILAIGKTSVYYRPGDAVRFYMDCASLAVFNKGYIRPRGLLAVEDVLSVEWAEREPADEEPEAEQPGGGAAKEAGGIPVATPPVVHPPAVSKGHVLADPAEESDRAVGEFKWPDTFAS